MTLPDGVVRDADTEHEGEPHAVMRIPGFGLEVRVSLPVVRAFMTQENASEDEALSWFWETAVEQLMEARAAGGEGGIPS